MAEKAVEHGREQPEATHRTVALELVWRCLRCGELWLRRDAPPEACPNCGAPPEELVLVTED